MNLDINFEERQLLLTLLIDFQVEMKADGNYPNDYILKVDSLFEKVVNSLHSVSKLD